MSAAQVAAEMEKVRVANVHLAINPFVDDDIRNRLKRI